jgi:type I restriction enzyme, S subunit
MDSNWTKGKLEDLAIIEMGQSPLGDTCNQDGIGVPLLNGPTEFGDYHPTPVQFTTDARKLSVPNDILFCVRGSTTGSMNWADQNYAIGRGIAAMRHRSGAEYRYFLKALIDLHLDKLLASATGSTFPNVSREQLANLDCEVPPLPKQRAIAGILGALDDKIEVNRRMNATLESIAWAVFRQWFVDGEEVEGWKIGKLGDVSENIRRSTNVDKIEPEAHYIGLEHMPRGSIALAEWGNASELASNKFIFKQGEFLFGKLRPYFHKVGIAPIDGVCSTDILVVAPKSPEWYGFVLGHISSVELINYTNAASTGTKMPRTNWSDIAKYEVPIPPVKLVKEFNEMFLPMAQQIRVNIMQLRTLGSLRDNLLPKLMRGQVRVKDVEGL